MLEQNINSKYITSKYICSVHSTLLSVFFIFQYQKELKEICAKFMPSRSYFLGFNFGCAKTKITSTLVNVYIDLLVFTCIAGTS